LKCIKIILKEYIVQDTFAKMRQYINLFFGFSQLTQISTYFWNCS